jgi:hypothetical protein
MVILFYYLFILFFEFKALQLTVNQRCSPSHQMTQVHQQEKFPGGVSGTSRIFQVLNINRYISKWVIKIKNCYGFSKADDFSKSLVFIEYKNIKFFKIGGSKELHGPAQTSAASSVHYNPSLKNYLKQKFIESLDIFGKLA